MKKIIKIIALVSIVFIVASMLSGCSFIKNLKENRVTVDKEGNLIYKDVKYIKIENSDDLYFEYDFDNEETIVIAKDDSEPILYSLFSSNYCDLSKNGILLEDSEANLYCREDKYADITGKIKNGFTPKKYIYTYEIYDEEDDFTWEEKVYYLTEEDIKVISDIFSNTKPIANAQNLSENSDYCVVIDGCTEDLMLRKFEFYIFTLDGKYYLEREDELYNPIVYQVPQEYNSRFKKIMKAYIKSSYIEY